MTTSTFTASPATTSAWNRILNAFRLQMANRWNFVWNPLIVLAGAFVISLAIYGILYTAGVESEFFGGGAQAPLWYFLGVGVQALTLTFPFSQALSVTRRDFYLGSMLAALFTSVMLGLIFAIGGLIEKATNGWGIGGYFFHLPWLWTGGPVLAGTFFTVVSLMLFTIGFWLATVYKRFGVPLVLLITIGFGLLLVAAIWLITANEWWPHVGHWLMDANVGSLTIGCLIATLVMSALSYATLRRATP